MQKRIDWFLILTTMSRTLVNLTLYIIVGPALCRTESHFLLFNGYEVGRCGVVVEIADGKATFRCHGKIEHADNLESYICNNNGYSRAIVRPYCFQ